MEHSQVKDAFKPKPGALDQAAIAEIARDFVNRAAEAIDAVDPDAIFNAAAEFARERGVTSADMGRVLAAARRKDPSIPPRVIRSWLLEGKAALGEIRNEAADDELAGQHLRVHGQQTDWTFKGWSTELNRWLDIFNHELFSGKLPAAIVSIEHARVDNLGSYRIGRDGLALKHRININARHIRESVGQTLAVLLHEQTHLWEDVAHFRRRGGSYHTRKFREKVASFGIPTDEGGHFLGIEPDGLFSRLLERHGVQVTGAAPQEAADSGRPRSRLAKWACGCRIIRVARGVGAAEIRCLRCDRLFEEKD